MMDDATLSGIEAAWKASPGNVPLLQVLLGALRERREYDRAIAHLKGVDAALLAAHDCKLLAAEIAIEGKAPEMALKFLIGDWPRELILRARALLALRRFTEGKRAYEEAIDMEPALEDTDLARALAAGAGTAEDATPRTFAEATDDTLREETDRVFHPSAPPVRFSDVGGLDDVKKTIHKKIILPFQKPGLFQIFRKRVGGGILLYGPPGCGKTLLARATAGECKARFFNVSISDVLNMYIGESESRLHALFERARESAPAVLFFDEIEGLGGKRQYSREGTSSKLVSQFLSEMDGFAQNNSGVLILGATNVPWAVDSAFRRPGRFDRVVFIPPPDQPARRAILQLLLEGRPVAPKLDLDFIAVSTAAFSGADLQNLVETAADAAIEESIAEGTERPITSAHLKSALREVKPTTLEWLTTARNYARYSNEGGQYDEVLDFLRKNGRDT